MDKKNIGHWLLLLTSALFIFLSIPFRLLKPRRKKRIVFYNQMHGNSKALADYVANHDSDIEMYYLAFPKYLKVYEGKQNLPTLSMTSLLDMIKVAQCDVLVTNYATHTLVYYSMFTDIKFVDVWHGLPMLKNQTPKIMKHLNHYSEIWLSSNEMKKFYKKKYKLKTKMIVTGYGRTDKLFNNEYNPVEVRNKYGLPASRKIVLIAPTWKHNNPNRSELPFGLTQSELIAELNSLAKETGCFIVFRAHMLSSDIGVAGRNIKALSTHDYPDTEEILSVADIVVTDWSSIAFDFMATKRPIIFIDSPAPFTGDELKNRCTPSNRLGKVIENIDDFNTTVTKYLNKPSSYTKENIHEIRRIESIAYGDMLDGNATKRYYKRLRRLLEL